MSLLLTWVSFIISMSFSEELDQSHYILFSGSMFYFTYLYNQIKPTQISIRTILLLFNIPSIILWYIAFVYNDFLCITPINYELFMSLVFVYIYLTIYVFFKYPQTTGKARLDVKKRLLNNSVYFF
jgi:hypothetical protein